MAGLTLFALFAALAGGCQTGPTVLGSQDQLAVSRSLVEYPPGFVLRPYMVGLTAPTAICIDASNTLFVAEGGGTADNLEPHIFGYRADAPPGKQFFDVYPHEHRFPIPFFDNSYHIYGPVGGMVAVNGQLFVTHKDAAGNGVVTAFGYDGTHRVVVADLPARGDYGMGGIDVDENGRLYFAVGSATNSGVVGLDNWEKGWVRPYADFCDLPYSPLKLVGARFNSSNPYAGLFSGGDIAVTGPYQAFNTSDKLRIPAAPNGKPSAAIYSVSQSGGDERVEAWGVHFASGIVCGDFDRVYFTDRGMEPRGTRPVVNDPDAVFTLISRGRLGAWYGWPDMSRSLEPIDLDKYQPPEELLRGTGYPEISALIDQASSKLPRPDPSNVIGNFPMQAGAAGLAIVPETGVFGKYRGGIVVALSGDRAPFSTGGGLILKQYTGYKVVRVDLVTHDVTPFVYNTEGGPGSALQLDGRALERPTDIKLGHDECMYILDYGHMTMNGGQERVDGGSGKIWRLMPENLDVNSVSATQP